MSDGAATSHIDGDTMDNEQRTEPSNSRRPSFEELIDPDRAPTSFGNLCASAGPSTGRDLIEQCEPMGLEAHRRPQDGRFVCPGCERSCRWWSNFCRHLRTHTNERPYPCNMCVRKFKTKYDLKMHCLAYHRNRTI